MFETANIAKDITLKLLEKIGACDMYETSGLKSCKEVADTAGEMYKIVYGAVESAVNPNRK